MADDASSTPYPLPAFHYSVSIGGGEALGFSEVSGLSMETQNIEYRDGLSPQYGVRQMSGIPKSSNITLKRGIIPKRNTFYEWINATQLNKPDRKNVVINLLNENHEPVMVWEAEKAWPVKVEGPSLNSTGNDVAFESIELIHEGLTIKTP